MDRNRIRCGQTVWTWVIVIGCAMAAKAADDGSALPYVRPPAADLQLPSDSGDHKLKFTTVISGQQVTLAYLLHLPADAAQAGHKLPMIVFFHGMGESGTDLSKAYNNGPMAMFRPDGDSTNPTLASHFPFVVLEPQRPPGGESWTDDFVCKACIELVSAVVHSAADRIDADRVYATGLSAGGLGTWCVAEEAPDLFAAVAPVSAMQWQPDIAADRLRFVPVWAVTGLNDQARFVDSGRAMAAALAGCPVPDRFTFAVNEGHDVYIPMYSNPQLYEWLLDHHRLSAGERQRLVAHPSATRPNFPTAPGHYLLTYDTVIDDQPVAMDYVLYIPQVIAPAGHPAMLFLQERDTIGLEFKDICMHGPDVAVEQDPAVADRFPFVVISPRLPMGLRWSDHSLVKPLAGLLDHVAAAVPVDPARVSISGVDSGAFAAWWLADALPRRFSALLWVTTQPDMGPLSDNGKLVENIPGRAFLPPNVASRVTRQFAAQFARTHLDWATAVLQPAVAATAYSDPSTLAWLANQRRRP